MIYCRKILIGSVPNCGLSWYSNTLGCRLFGSYKAGKYFNSAWLNSFNYASTRLFYILPLYLRDDLISLKRLLERKIGKSFSAILYKPRIYYLNSWDWNPLTSGSPNHKFTRYLSLNWLGEGSWSTIPLRTTQRIYHDGTVVICKLVSSVCFIPRVLVQGK